MGQKEVKALPTDGRDLNPGRLLDAECILLKNSKQIIPGPYKADPCPKPAFSQADLEPCRKLQYAYQCIR